jgi:hypothetical protein
MFPNGKTYTFFPIREKKFSIESEQKCVTKKLVTCIMLFIKQYSFLVHQPHVCKTIYDGNNSQFLAKRHEISQFQGFRSYSQNGEKSPVHVKVQ